ncbi:uncharacterized protein LOC120917848 isoform X2 [Rana temporaria]|uniref:uncharacterized protein LOC120917848 isoform X2 n=1 Tax=Rana temporaria TaxID=8407 RepID=UPI001AAE02B8|nr:uncharacterized protein LOC120917848 isoform X2 [Rana temporaria]
MSAFVAVGVAALAAFLAKWLLSGNNNPTNNNGMYPVPGRWYHLKKNIFWLLVQLGSVLQSLGLRKSPGEKPAPLTEDDQRKIVPNAETTHHTEHPDTIVDDDSDTAWRTSGFCIGYEEPLQKWKITFNGNLRKGPFQYRDSKDETQTIHVKFSLLWTPKSKLFDFGSGMHPGAITHSMALEDINRLPAILRSSNEHFRFEQWGDYDINVAIEGQERKTLKMEGLRNRSYGLRNWAEFHRYIMFLMVFETGELVHLNVVSIPQTTRHFTLGYMFLLDGRKEGIQSSNVLLSQYAEDEDIKDHYVFNFTAGGKTYNVCAKLDQKTSPFVYNGKPPVGFTHECIADFTMAPAHKGWGVVEFYFRKEQ